MKLSKTTLCYGNGTYRPFFCMDSSLFHISNIYCKQPTGTGTNMEMKIFKS